MLASAAVFHAPGKPFSLEAFSIPSMEPGETLVRIRCATICGSDLHTYYGRRQSPAPSILGHEMMGEVAAVHADGVRYYESGRIEVGDRVTWSMVWSCGECFYCVRGLCSKCERLFKFGHERIGVGRDLSGAYAEYCHLPAGTAVFQVPDTVCDAAAASSNCATATAAAVMRNAGPVAGNSVLVYGAGMLGLTACAMAREAGAAQVIVVEKNEGRRAMALRFGATMAVDAGERLYEEVMGATEGRGADVVLELAGTPEACESAVARLRVGGQLVMAGAVFPTRPMALAAEQVVRRMLRIVGVYNYQPRDLGTALRFLEGAQEKYPFSELIGKRFPLREINAAVAYAEGEKPPRVALIP
jgi:alcohol dehydrogenase